MAGLRDYQQQLLEQAEAALTSATGARVMLQLPTGGGKTHIAGALLRCWLHNGRKAVWLTHREQLADQTCGMLTDAGVSASNNISWIVGNDAPHIANGVVILMAQTVGRRTNRMQIWGKYRSDDLLVIDEAHHATADGYERAIKQWPGRILGLTATPWRLSKIEGFDHLFSELFHGPQVSELQVNGWLCQARVLMPKPEDVIRGGAINTIGEYSESGIEQANQDRPDVMTAGALRFWQFHAAERQTVVYAISQDHARNLAAVFNNAGIPAAVMLSDTLPQERTKAIKSFGNGTLRVLVNVAVATEGFDLPDASCVVITRPTMSLALYLQMVGRGLRPKANGGNCLVLDLAGNAELHGLPEDERQWSLMPRGNNPKGDAPVIRCEKCDALSPAASHECAQCGTPFGKVCPRCGQWRAQLRWSYETHCGNQHDLVCDLCHYDAHIQAHLPVNDEIKALSALDSSESNDEEQHDLIAENFILDNSGDTNLDGEWKEVEQELTAALQKLLGVERRRASGPDEKRKAELRSMISLRESEMANDDNLGLAFDRYIEGLPLWDRPRQNGPQKYRLYGEWEDGIKQELESWRSELNKLEAKVPDGRLIYNNARERVLQVLESISQEDRLLSQAPPQRETPTLRRKPISENTNPAQTDISGWVTFTDLAEWFRKKPDKAPQFDPQKIRDPKGNEIPVSNWSNLLKETADWLAQAGYLTSEKCPVTVGNMNKRYLIDVQPTHPNGRTFTTKNARLSNGLHIELQWGPKSMARRCCELLADFGQDPEQFHVQLA